MRERKPLVNNEGSPSVSAHLSLLKRRPVPRHRYQSVAEANAHATQPGAEPQLKTTFASLPWASFCTSKLNAPGQGEPAGESVSYLISADKLNKFGAQIPGGINAGKLVGPVCTIHSHRNPFAGRATIVIHLCVPAFYAPV